MLPIATGVVCITKHNLWYYASKIWNIYCVFTYIYSLLIKKDICDHWNISVSFHCLCMSFIRRSLHFFSKSFFFLFLLFCVIHTLVLPFTCNLFLIIGWILFETSPNIYMKTKRKCVDIILLVYQYCFVIDRNIY